MEADWLIALAWLSLAMAFACAAVIVADTLIGQRRQQMRVMEWVWPITALYAGPVALWFYWRYGRPMSQTWQRDRGFDGPPDKPRWATVSVGVSHCGAGCTLGDIIAATLVFLVGVEIAGRALWPELIGGYLLALALGLAFQYFAIAPMRGLGVREGILAAAKADVLSLTAFEVGLFGWMVIQALVLVPAGDTLHPDSAVYWLGMQVGMCLGFATAYPVNSWLIRRGIKEAM